MDAALGDDDFCLTLDGELTLVACNETFARWLGYSAAEALHGCSLAETLDPGSRPKLNLLQQRLNRGQVTIIELNHRTTAGAIVLARYHVLPPETLGPAQVHRIALGSDRQPSLDLLEEIIALKREREEQLEHLRELNRRLEQRNADLASLSHMVRHDVANSLNAIHLNATMLQLDQDDPAAVHEGTDEILGLCEHINGLLQGFISLADASRVSRDPIQANVADAAHAMLDLVVARWVDVPYQAHCQFDVPHVWTDPHHLRQVLENLLDNAFKYRDPTRPLLELRLATRRLGESVELTIADNGRGIPEDSRPDIFDLFRRVHSDAGPGEGIGLAIVKRLVEANGGTLSLESRSGHGSCFRILLPADPSVA